MSAYRIIYSSELYHHGILKQRWGIRHGPPYPLSAGSYSKTEKKAIVKERRNHPNSIYNKKHFDTVINEGAKLSTLSYDKDRTKNVDMFYAAYKKLDKHQYNALFNKAVDKGLYDADGNKVGTGKFLKYRIDNKAKTDIKVASEDSASEVFKKLYTKNRDFYNFVTDKDRMQSYFVNDKYKFRGYRESKQVLDKMKNPDYKPTDTDIATLYRMFNYVIPYDGAGDSYKGHDVAVQRAKFFKECQKEGYGALLDTNDAIYGGFKATAPVIVFDMEKIVPDSVYQTKQSDKTFSELVLAGRKILGV